MSIQVQLSINDRQVEILLYGIAKRVEDATPVMREIGEIVRESVMLNFREGQSPEGDDWEPSKRAIEEKGKTLIDKAILRNSIHVVAGPSFVSVGTPDKRAATHQFGAARGSFKHMFVNVKSHLRKARDGGIPSYVHAHKRYTRLPWGDIPARPFLGIREEDWPDIKDALLDYITGLRA